MGRISPISGVGLKGIGSHDRRSNLDPLDLIEADLVAPAVVELSPISARSRRPACVAISMLSSSARFRWIEHRRLASCHNVTRAAHRAGRVDRHDLAGDEPIEKMADRGEPLLGRSAL